MCPPWCGAAIGIIFTGLCSVAGYQLRVASPPGGGLGLGPGLSLGLGSGPGRPQSYLALSGDLLVEIRQLPVWARGRRLQLLLLEHVSNGPPIATAASAGSPPEYTVQGSVPVSVPSSAPSTAANTGGRLQWVRGYSRSGGGAGSGVAPAAGRSVALGKMTSTWRPEAENATGSAPAPAPAAPSRAAPPPTTLKPIVARFPCGFVSRGGRYALRLAGLERTKKTTSRKEERDDTENESEERAAATNRVAGGELKQAAVQAAPQAASTASTTTTPVRTRTAPRNTTTKARATFDPALPATNETGGLFLLDVLWPRARLSLGPKEIATYPEEAVRATVEFLGVRCPSAKGSPVSESWLDLVYCGPVATDCTYGNYTTRQILHSEQVLGYPHHMAVALSCDLFGMAGFYSLHLRAGRPSAAAWPLDASTNATIKAVWSDRFVFNVHARSIFPCAAHSGVSALFTYPGCVLPAGDRVRLFARLRADVSTLLPPLTLQYVAEQRVAKGTHAVAFDCDLFSERYVEYCFVYVSQAITGAVTDVRMDCVPTLPVSEADSGSWGAWSPWSACTSTCGGGTRNRYRFCDSPPPRYGAKFCEGSSLETMRCGPDNEWDCAPEGVSADLPLAAAPPPPPPQSDGRPGPGPAQGAPVNSGCRCGCVVHLGTTKPGTLLASSSKSCPGRSFWLVQADANHAVRLRVQQQRLSCGAQWLRVRDGDSLGGRLLLALGSDQPGLPAEAVSTSNTMLVEFYSDEAVAALEECAAGFLAHAQQAVPANETLVGYPLAVAGLGAGAGAVGLVGGPDAWWAAGLRLTVVHAAAVAFLGCVLLLSACLCAQYGHRYRKYQLTAAKEDLETLSLTDNEETVGALVRAASSATLVSEVLSLKGFKISKEQKRATQETSALGGSVDSVASGSVTVSVGSPQSGGTGCSSSQGAARSASPAPLGAAAALGPPPGATASLPNSPQQSGSPGCSPTAPRPPSAPGAMRRSGSCERAAAPPRRPGNVRLGPRQTGGLVSPVREEDQIVAGAGVGEAPAGGPMALEHAEPLGPGPAGGPGAAAGAGKWRPRPPPRLAGGLARGVASNASSTSTLVNDGAGAPGSPASSVRSWSMRSSTASMASTLSTASTSSNASCSSSRTATPTNPLSPPPGAPRPGLRHHPGGLHLPVGTNPKESKDRRNRERLLRAAGLAGPTAGSEFSLGPDTELEMDYYDYNVHNACAAPGSLLGMDPAYLLWIPPFTPGSAGSWEEEGEDGSESCRLFSSDGDGSGAESDHPLQVRERAEESGGGGGVELRELRCAGTLGPLREEQRAQIHTARVTELSVKESDARLELAPAPAPAPARPALTLQELGSSPRRLPGRPGETVSGDFEKETSVVKSPSDQRLLYRLHQHVDDDDDDIKFADDGDDDDCEDIFIKDSKVDPKTVPLLGKRGDVNV